MRVLIYLQNRSTYLYGGGTTCVQMKTWKVSLVIKRAERSRGKSRSAGKQREKKPKRQAERRQEKQELTEAGW